MHNRSWPTIPDLSRHTGLKEKQLHAFADEGILKTLENPKAIKENRRSVRQIIPWQLPHFLAETLQMPDDMVAKIMAELGFSFFFKVA